VKFVNSGVPYALASTSECDSETPTTSSSLSKIKNAELFVEIVKWLKYNTVDYLVLMLYQFLKLWNTELGVVGQHKQGIWNKAVWHFIQLPRQNKENNEHTPSI